MRKWLFRELASRYAMLFATPLLFSLHKMLFNISLRGMGILNWKSTIVSGEDYFVKKILPKYIQSDAPVFFDVGANRGDFSKMLVEIFPNSRIFCFEPHPDNFASLSSIKHENIHFFEIALSDRKGVLSLFDTEGYSGTVNASLYKSVITEIHHEEPKQFSVTVDTLDNIVNNLQVEFIDFLKIDVEGGEFFVLKGGHELLKKKKIRLIQFEFNEMNVYSRVFMRDFQSLLEDYELFRLLPGGMVKISSIPVLSEIFAYQNIVAIPRGYG